MTYLHYLLFTFSSILCVCGSVRAQNPDSVKAYIREFIKPDTELSMNYGTSSLSLEYVEQSPLTPLTEAFIEEKKEEYERTNDPMTLYTIAQTYNRMNRRSEGRKWAERAMNEIEIAIQTYPDSIELVESILLISFDTGQTKLAATAAKMIADHYQNSESLFVEALTYNFTGEHEKGIELTNKGLELYPGEARWYLVRIIHEFTNKMKKYGFLSDEFRAEENRIDQSFLTEGFEKYPDSVQVELVSILGDFFLFAYEEVMPNLYEQLLGDVDIERIEFELTPAIHEKLDMYFKKVSKLKKRKEFKKWHAVYYTLGMIHLYRSEHEEAIENFEKAIDLMKPKYRQGQENVYHYYDNLITCHRILGDVASAEKCAIARATEEINIDPVPGYYIEMAMYRAMDDDLESAKTILDQAIAIDSSAINAYTHKALVFMCQDEKNEAYNYLKLAQSIDPNNVLSFKAMIFFNLLEKESELAEQQIGQLEEYDPTDSFITESRRLLNTN